MFEAHTTVLALALALFSAGRSIPARIAIIAITTRSSISVKLPIVCIIGSFTAKPGMSIPFGITAKPYANSME